MGAPPLHKALLLELFGNAAFKFAVTAVGLLATALECGGAPAGCTAVSPFFLTLMTIFVLIPKLGFATGGHFNTSVTMSAAAAGSLSVVRLVLYTGCQCAGVVLAMSLIKTLTPPSYHDRVSAPSSPLPPAYAAVLEFAFGFINTLIGLFADAFGEYKAWWVSSLVIVQILVSGASMDPTGALAGAYFHQDYTLLLEIYWIPSLLGAALAGLFHRIVTKHFLKLAGTLCVQLVCVLGVTTAILTKSDPMRMKVD